jgi:diguanylate cyclase (GGDEF)-like protein
VVPGGADLPAVRRWGSSSPAASSAAISFVIAGTLTVANSFLAAARFEEHGGDAAALRWSGVAAILVGVAAWVLPWERWPSRATLVLAVAGLGLLCAGDVTARSAATPDGLMISSTMVTLLFVWLGVTQPRGTAAVFAPAVFAGLFLTVRVEGVDIRTLPIVIAVVIGALVGELVAWSMGRDRRRAEDLGILIDSTGELFSGTDATQVAMHIARSAARMLHASRVTVYLRQRPSADEVVASYPEEGSDGAECEPDGPALDDLVDDQESGVVIPLRGRTGLDHGRVVIDGRARDSFTAQLTRLFGDQIGSRLDDLELVANLTTDALRDPLTGVGNRRLADHLLAGVTAGDAIAVIDVDHFREVNERLGHAGGDAVLRDVAAYLRASVRGADTVARLGGDEFLVVVRDIGGGAEAAVARLLAHWNDDARVATFSAGVALHDGGDPNLTLRRADETLYQAKRAGRAMVHLASM